MRELSSVVGRRPIPLGDLRRESSEFGPEIEAAIHRVLSRGQYILGPEVAAFEHEFAAYCGVRHAVAVACGTDAITLALVGAGVSPGDEVITSSLTSAATVTAIVRAGARPILVDVEEETFNLDPGLVARSITDRTRAIVPVHLYGRPVDPDTLQQCTHTLGIAVIEDACQAHGASVRGQRVGGLGLAGCFSFYPSKNLGAYGDGGMVTTGDSDVADRVRMARQYGWRERDRSETIGFNSRLDEIQAAILRAKLPHLDDMNRRRNDLARRYQQGLADLKDIRLPSPIEGHVFHLYVVRVIARDRIRARLAQHGIATGVHYPFPIHQQPAFRPFVENPGAFPVTDRLVSEILTLPIFPQLTDEEADRVIEALTMELRYVA